jgi:hypothetical protein
MRLLRRILTTVVIALGMIALGLSWVAPVALSFDAARKASPVARVVPTDLDDLSVSPVHGTKVSYVGYEFKIPWTDLDESQTRLFPKDNPAMAVLVFRSGLHMIVMTSLANTFPNGFAREWKGSPQALKPFLGRGGAQSDYSFHENLYHFTPDKMHRWALFPSVHYREQMLLVLKEVILSDSSADTGIFNIQNQGSRGFQLGNPRAHPNRVAVQLYSSEGGVELTLADARRPVGVTQPEINLIVESLRRVPRRDPANPQTSLK